VKGGCHSLYAEEKLGNGISDAGILSPLTNNMNKCSAVGMMRVHEVRRKQTPTAGGCCGSDFYIILRLTSCVLFGFICEIQNAISE
jgi:hypothetical protein